MILIILLLCLLIAYRLGKMLQGEFAFHTLWLFSQMQQEGKERIQRILDTVMAHFGMPVALYVIDKEGEFTCGMDLCPFFLFSKKPGVIKINKPFADYLDERLLGSVLAHEIAHAIRLQKEKRPLSILLAILNIRSKREEFACDALGATFAGKHVMIEVLEKLIDYHYRFVPDFLLTHPCAHHRGSPELRYRIGRLRKANLPIKLPDTTRDPVTIA